jgi:hypothetical protein
MRFGIGIVVAFACVLLMSVGCGHSSHNNNSVIPPSDRFVDKGNGTVMDTQTGLVWLKNANCFGLMNWDNATAAANALASGQCGLTDGSTAGQWRLPTLGCPLNQNCTLATPPTGEFATIFASTCAAPYILDTAGTGCWTEGNPFSGVKSSYYWSSSTYIANPDGSAWDVNLNFNGVSADFKANTSYVWPVRNGP